MTLIGKFLAYLNLIVGLGIITTSATVYSLRPAWFDPIPEGGITPGQTPENFKMMAAEIDALNRTAKAAADNAAVQKAAFEELQNKRDDRRKKYDERLNWARNGNPKDTEGAGFYEPVYEKEKDTGLLDLTTLGAAIKGTDEKPLKGADKLLANFGSDIDEIEKLTKAIVKARDEFAVIRGVILRTEQRLLKMTDIREEVQSELFYLAAFEFNVYETRETVFRRKKQLDDRLKELK